MKLRLVVIALFVALIGCSGPGQASTKTIDVSMDDVLHQSAISRDVALTVGETLKVSLGANHSTPYRWTPDPKIGDGAVVKQATHEYIHGESNRPGAPGTEVWTFTASKVGKTTIVASYGPVVGDGPASCTFTANVTVQ